MFFFLFALVFKACGNKVDPVYEALRFGTSLAQKAKRASGSDSPHRNSVRGQSIHNINNNIYLYILFLASYTLA